MNRPPIVIADWKAWESGTLRGFFTAHLASGLVLHELMLHERDGKWWIGFPSKPMLRTEGSVLRDDSGRVRYSPPLVTFTNRQAKDRFTDQVITALRLAQPQVFATEAAA
jgi:hypothetical protein